MALVVITGTAGSGKSAVADDLALRRQRQTGKAVRLVRFESPYANEATQTAHAYERPAGFATVDDPPLDGWVDQASCDEVLVVDCVAALLAAVMAQQVELPAGSGGSHTEGEEALEWMMEQVNALVQREGDTIVVTNEVGGGMPSEHGSSRVFRDVLGVVNRHLVSHADSAYLSVCGRLISLDRLPAALDWPED